MSVYDQSLAIAAADARTTDPGQISHESAMRTIFYHQLYWAITEFPFYKTILAQPLRQTLLYLLYLCAHASLIVTLANAFHFGPEFREFGIWLQENVPPMQVSEGRLRIESDQPLIQTYTGRHPVTLIFDTTGKRQDLARFPEPLLLFTQDALVLRQNQTLETFPWRDFGSFQVTPEQIRDWLELIKWAYFPTAYSLFLVFTFAFKLILALLFSLLALSVTSRYQVRFPFPAYLAIAIYSLTPAVAIETAVTLTGLSIRYLEVISLATTGIYTYMATSRIMAEKTAR